MALFSFIKEESRSGVVLIFAAALGLAWANSPFAPAYQSLLHAKIGPVEIFGLHLSVHEWVDDGLMAVFFLLVGLEIKRAVLIGELATPQRAGLAAIAAAGGIVVPAAICAAFLWHDSARIGGWAIPTATDIAFALAALSFAGSGLPASLKVFLTALAVIDDLGAICIIAVFYTSDLVAPMLFAAIACLAVAVALNRLRVTALWPYLAVGAAMWYCLLLSGVHATLAGVALAFTIPLRGRIDARGHVDSPLKRLEHALQLYVSFAIVPIFGLLNAGVSFRAITPAMLAGALPLGIVCGLFFGKQIGIFLSAFVAVKLRVVDLPPGVTWPMLYGVAVLGGIGFTMSLFIGGLAFSDATILDEMKIGVLIGSTVSGVAGVAMLRSLRRVRAVRAAA